MLFNSWQFGLFLPVVFIVYWLMPHRFRWFVLLVASYWFYMSWNPKYVVLILFTTAVSYAAGLLLERQSSKTVRKWTVAISSVAFFSVLFFFKYFNFLSSSVTSFLSLFAIKLSPVTLDLLLPVGISFYTFQTLSYVIDVYRGSVKAERHFGKYATFVSFFPQLVAGPIERTGNLLPQIKAEHKFDYASATEGIKLMAWGFFKKIVIADTISLYAGSVFDAPQQYTGFSLLLAMLLFTFQIYCDFSGYSDIAIGTARLMGINLMTNFKSPYFSQSIKEFWSRWHISLSTWFRDYLYIPLGGNRVGKLRHAFNLLVTFLVSGLWHGANWTFVIWGGIHGLAQVLESFFVPKNRLKSKGVLRWLRTVIVFAFCSVAWVFFASNSFQDAVYVLSHMFDGIASPAAYFSSGLSASAAAMGDIEQIMLVFSLLLLAVFDYFSINGNVIAVISSKKTAIRWAVYVIFVLWVILNLPNTSTTEFIYFQF